MDKRYNDCHFGGEGSSGFIDVKKSTPYSEVLGNLEEEVGGGVQCQSLFSALSGLWAYKWCTTLKVPSTWKMTKQRQLSNSHPYCAFEPCCSNWKEIRHRGKLAFLSCHLSGLPPQCQEVETCTGSPRWERPGSVDLLGSMTLAIAPFSLFLFPCGLSFRIWISKTFLLQFQMISWYLCWLSHPRVADWTFCLLVGFWHWPECFWFSCPPSPNHSKFSFNHPCLESWTIHPLTGTELSCFRLWYSSPKM